MSVERHLGQIEGELAAFRAEMREDLRGLSSQMLTVMERTARLEERAATSPKTPDTKIQTTAITTIATVVSTVIVTVVNALTKTTGGS